MSSSLGGFGKDFDQSLGETLRQIRGQGKDQVEKFEKDKPIPRSSIDVIAVMTRHNSFAEHSGMKKICESEIDRFFRRLLNSKS